MKSQHPPLMLCAKDSSVGLVRTLRPLGDIAFRIASIVAGTIGSFIEYGENGLIPMVTGGRELFG